MKIRSLVLVNGKLSALFALVFLLGSLWATGAPGQPTILSVRVDGKDVVVVVQVPDGLAKVTLESRARFGAGTWEPRAVARINPQLSQVTFRLPMSAKLEMLRVRADATEPLPSFFYQGSTNFRGAPTSSPGDATLFRLDNAVGVPETSAPTATDATRNVVESDIYKIQGQTLYFYNQYRGLQIISLADPANPALQGTLSLPAAGEQMYLLDPQHVILLARQGCNYYGSGGEESQIVVVEVNGGLPSVIARMPVTGQIQESRMVGTALYVASQTYRPISGDSNGAWQWGTYVTSFDLADPRAPQSRSSLWFTGYGQVVMATDRYFFIAPTDTTNWRSSTIHCIDITAPDGVMKTAGSLVPAGRVNDKFKMQLQGNIFTVISEVWSDSRRWVTTLETFSLADPASPVKLGTLELAQGEQLHATRFDGDRVYIVTFFRIDPLWVVDLSDPAHPAIKGELQVPGWSTFIQPLGDRLVSIGIDNSNSWRVAVSLFDVKDPAKPALLKKIPLGDNFSWSEANYDEKAFNVMAEANLILVPFQGDYTNGYASRVQLIEMTINHTSDDTLTARGTIEHQFQPRRATLFENNIYSISGQQLLSVDVSNRDTPLVRAAQDLAWDVNRVFLSGDYLLSVTDSPYWGNPVGPVIRVTPALDPAKILAQLTLRTNLPIVGATRNGDYLYLAQANQGYYYPILADTTKEGSDTGSPGGPTNVLVMSVFNLQSLPALTLTSEIQVDLGANGLSTLQALWPKPGLLVWSGGYSWYGWGFRGAMVDTIMPGRFWQPWYIGGGGRFLAFDVKEATAPTLASDLDLNKTNRWSFSTAYTSGNLIYISHQSSDFLPDVKSPYPPSPITVYDPVTGKSETTPAPVGTWVNKYYLDVIDYADPAVPMARQPVNIPGTLKGLGYEGALVYTVANHWTSDWTTDWRDWLDASAYDGVSAALVDSLQLPAAWPHPLVVLAGSIYIGQPGTTATAFQGLETWSVLNTGHFARQSMVQVPASQDLQAIGNMLVSQSTTGTYTLLNVSNPSNLQATGSDQVAGCIWGDLSNADGAADRGLWLPLGSYGVTLIGVKPGSP